MDRPKRVLVYDDDEACNYATAKLLRTAGLAAESALNFSEALRILEGRAPPDLLIADIVFPKGQVNGLAMARMACMKRLGLKVIYLTGFDVSPGEREALGPVLQKPVPDEELLAQVNKALADEFRRGPAPASAA